MAFSVFAGITNRDTKPEDIQQQVILNPQPAALPQPMGFLDDGMPVWYKAICAAIMGTMYTSASTKSGAIEPISTKMIKFTLGSALGYFMLHQMDQILK